MKVRLKTIRPHPVAAIYPDGGDPLYEEAGTGMRYTAQDFAARHGYANAKEVEKAYQEAINDRRPTEPNDHQDSTGF